MSGEPSRFPGFSICGQFPFDNLSIAASHAAEGELILLSLRIRLDDGVDLVDDPLVFTSPDKLPRPDVTNGPVLTNVDVC